MDPTSAETAASCTRPWSHHLQYQEATMKSRNKNKSRSPGEGHYCPQHTLSQTRTVPALLPRRSGQARHVLNTWLADYDFCWRLEHWLKLSSVLYFVVVNIPSAVSWCTLLRNFRKSAFTDRHIDSVTDIFNIASERDVRWHAWL